VHYLFQRNELQVPGSDQTKLNLGNEVCAALRAGDRPRADISVLQQRTGLSLYRHKRGSFRPLRGSPYN
jgi:hypothetical protein